MTGQENLAGRIWSMSHEQEISLKRVWAMLLKFYGYELQFSLGEIKSPRTFCSSSNLHSEASSPTMAISSTHLRSGSTQSWQELFNVKLLNEKVRSNYVYLKSGALNNETFDAFSVSTRDESATHMGYLPEEIHRSMWSLCRNDSLDNFILKFIRMSKCDVETSFKWLLDTLEKRINKYLTEDLVNRGDAFYFFRKDKPELVQALKKNIMFMHGEGKNGKPLIIIRVKEHIRGHCSDEDFQTLVLMTIEWSRLRLLEFKNGIDQCYHLFDVSDFSFRNADYNGIRFIIKTFQTSYPDSVELIFIHNAPKVFTIMWNVIKRWIKAEVREKIIFTHGPDDLRPFIDDRYIPRSLGGDGLNFTPYVEPDDGNYRCKEPDEMLDRIAKQRENLKIKYLESTIRWVEASSPTESRKHLNEKIKLSRAMAENYVLLDPYIRQRGVLDRNGELVHISI